MKNGGALVMDFVSTIDKLEDLRDLGRRVRFKCRFPEHKVVGTPIINIFVGIFLCIQIITKSC